MIAPCKDCKKRELKCHSKCAEYAEFRKIVDAENKTRREMDSVMLYININMIPRKRNVRSKLK